MASTSRPAAADARRASLHRMVMPGHTCPYGLKALHLLKSRGFEVDIVTVVNADVERDRVPRVQVGDPALRQQRPDRRGRAGAAAARAGT